jgi:enolase
MKIAKIQAQEILDSRGNPTVETEVGLENGITATAAVPSGASTGSYEAIELRDGDESRYMGKGVLKAVKNVNTKIAEVLVGLETENQEQIDQKMLELDGTENKSSLGANAILSVSIAVSRAAALSLSMPLYRYIAQMFGTEPEKYVMPIPMINVLNGGKHAIRSTDLQEYLIMPIGAPSLQEAVRWGAEVFHNLGKIIKEMGFATTVGDEGGYAPSLESNEQPFGLLTQAIEKAGYRAGTDLAFGLDSAAASFLENGKYNLTKDDKILTTEEMVNMYVGWAGKYPIVSYEDAFGEDDWDGFQKLTAKIGNRVQIVGDDLYVTNVKRLERGIREKTTNSILIKLNQIGTVTETLQAIRMANDAGLTAVVSHRSGETEDTFIADLVVGTGTGQIKTGSMSRSERICKYNRLMAIERELGDKAVMAKWLFKRV